MKFKLMLHILFFTFRFSFPVESQFDLVQARPPASGERFIATKSWKKIEPIAWRIATEHGLRGWQRRLFMVIIWNESRGYPHVIGDHGCAKGLMQLHVGGYRNDNNRKCTDNRKVFPKWLAKYQPIDFLNPVINLHAGAILFLKMQGNASDPFMATAKFGGCKYNSACAKFIWGRHKWWWETGLKDRVLALERSEK